MSLYKYSELIVIVLCTFISQVGASTVHVTPEPTPMQLRVTSNSGESDEDVVLSSIMNVRDNTYLGMRKSGDDHMSAVLFYPDNTQDMKQSNWLIKRSGEFLTLRNQAFPDYCLGFNDDSFGQSVFGVLQAIKCTDLKRNFELTPTTSGAVLLTLKIGATNMCISSPVNLSSVPNDETVLLGDCTGKDTTLFKRALLTRYTWVIGPFHDESVTVVSKDEPK